LEGSLKNKRKFLLLIVLVLLVSCSNEEMVEPISEENNPEEETQESEVLELFNTTDYIDTDDQSINFLFKTNDHTTIDFYLGKDSNALELYKTLDNYDMRRGLKVEGLVPNQEYYYQIVVKNGVSEIKSDILSFKKRKLLKEQENVKWAKESVFYEIFVRSFYDSNGDGIGDFNGVTKKLDYIETLGVDALWLMPFNESPSYHGYDTTDYYQVNFDYGSLKDLENLIEAAHSKDIKIIMDLVINHSSSEHPWFRKALDNQEYYKDYYVWATPFDSLGETGEWGQKIWHSKKPENYYMGIFWQEMPDLNLRNPEVRDEMKAIAKFWIDLGIDGFRLDASKHIDHDESAYTHLWWREFNNYVKSLDSETYLVGENWNSNVNVITPYYKYMDSSFNFAFSDLIIKTVNNQTYQNILVEQLEMHNKFSKSNKDFIDATFIRNHDMSRTLSEVFDNKDKAKLAAAIHLTLPGTPFIYYGEELGQKGKKPDEHIREPFDWYASSTGEGMTNMIKSGFKTAQNFTKANDGISLEEAAEDPDSIFNYYKKLIDVRKGHKDFFYSNYKPIDINKNILAYFVGDEEKLIVIHNIHSKSQTIDISEWIGGSSKELLTNKVLDDKILLEAYDSIIIENN
jgi:glycosidase